MPPGANVAPSIISTPSMPCAGRGMDAFDGPFAAGALAPWRWESTAIATAATATATPTASTGTRLASKRVWWCG